MIGQLINKFDNANDTTLKAFNNTFRMSLKGDLSAEVVIGKPMVGGLRELLIGGNMELIELKRFNPEVKEQEHIAHEVYYEGNFFGIFPSCQVIADLLGSNNTTIARYEKEEMPYFGYTFKAKKVNKSTLDEIKSYKVPEKVILDRTKRRKNRKGGGMPSIYEYFIEKTNGETGIFSSTGKAGVFVDKGRRTLEHRIKKGNEEFRKGWKVIRRLKGEFNGNN